MRSVAAKEKCEQSLIKIPNKSQKNSRKTQTHTHTHKHLTDGTFSELLRGACHIIYHNLTRNPRETNKRIVQEVFVALTFYLLTYVNAFIVGVFFLSFAFAPNDN